MNIFQMFHNKLSFPSDDVVLKSELKKNSNATFIGEETSGSINHYGEVRGFNLPKSDIVIAFSTKYWEVWKGKKRPFNCDIVFLLWHTNCHDYRSTDPFNNGYNKNMIKYKNILFGTEKTK